MIQIEQRGNSTYYNLDRTKLPKQHIDTKEMRLIDGDVANSVTSTGNRATNARGLVPLVKQYGTSLNGSGTGATLDTAFFRDLLS